MKYPLAPLVVALVLGDPTERELREALISRGGDPFVFFSTPVSATLMLLAFALLCAASPRAGVRAPSRPNSR
ncbi:MAG: hypothetical protein H0U97_08675 [Gammaproteobacteria bacterium]|nr:hypothetical protein [Gammaproteobacteria bacterium]